MMPPTEVHTGAGRALVDLRGCFLDVLRQLLRDALRDLAQLPQRPVGLQLGQRAGQRAHRRLLLAIELGRQRHLRTSLQVTPAIKQGQGVGVQPQLLNQHVHADVSLKMVETDADAAPDRHRVVLQMLITDLLVVIEDDDHVRIQEPGVVHRLVRHAAGDRTVADDGDAVVVPLLQHDKQAAIRSALRVRRYQA